MRNRIGYQNVALLTGPSPAYQAHSGQAINPNNAGPEGEIQSKLKVLNTVQAASFDIGINRAEVKHISSDKALAVRPTFTQPAVSLGFSYLLTDGRNEQALGFHASGDASFLSGVTGNDDRNFFLFVTEKSQQDFNFLSGYKNLSVLSFGNCYANSYSLDASVGTMPVVSVDYSASNVTFDQLSGTSGYYRPPSAAERDIVASGVIPAVDRQNGVLASDMTNYGYIVKRGDITDGGVFNSGDTHYLKPGNIDLFLSNPNIGGIAPSGGSTKMHVQNVSINIPINRTDLMGFGSKYVYDRKTEYPSLGQIEFSAIAGANIAEGDTDTIFSKDDVYQMEIIFSTTDSSATKTRSVSTKIQNAKIQSQSINQSIGQNLMFDASFSFECSPTTGFVLSGIGYEGSLFSSLGLN
jgi:hypothetical protein